MKHPLSKNATNLILSSNDPGEKPYTNIYQLDMDCRGQYRSIVIANYCCTLLVVRPDLTKFHHSTCPPNLRQNQPIERANWQRLHVLPFLPQSWKWKTTPNERKLPLEGPNFHFHDYGRKCMSCLFALICLKFLFSEVSIITKSNYVNHHQTPSSQTLGHVVHSFRFILI